MLKLTTRCVTVLHGGLFAGKTGPAGDLEGLPVGSLPFFGVFAVVPVSRCCQEIRGLVPVLSQYVVRL